MTENNKGLYDKGKEQLEKVDWMGTLKSVAKGAATIAAGAVATVIGIYAFNWLSAPKEEAK